MSTYRVKIQWRTCTNLEQINAAIMEGRADWPGLMSADQIISITWVEEKHSYMVVWKVREWLNGDGDVP